VGNRHALTTSYGFAAAGMDLFTAIINGATLYTYDVRTRGPSVMAEWIRDREIAWMAFVPAGLRAVAATAAPGALDCLRIVGFGGDTAFWRDVEMGRRICGPETMFVNVLGSTEAGHVTSFDVLPDTALGEGPVPVGVPDRGVEVRLVDEDDEPVAHGEPGSIVVVRHGWLALRYWNDPELTRRHFFREPDGRRGFRTADAARWRDDGLLEHVGRIDSRVKVRGAMVATSEVELALRAHSDVADAAVVAVPDESGLRLVAYVMARDGRSLSAWKLRRDLATTLSSTSVPSAFVAVAILPRTIRDKVDRGALPPPPPPVRHRAYREPKGNENDLAEIFASVLGIERVGLDDDFFELGGDSLATVELLAAIADRFSVDLSTSTVLDAPTVAELALRLSHRRPHHASPLVPLRTSSEGPTFFCVTGGGAPAISLRALSETMPDVSLYALQARGLEERAWPDHSVSSAARRYVCAIRNVQASGPYVLGGYSFGGIVAFEMACQLRAAGEEVALLVEFDTPAPAPRTGTRVQRIASRARQRAFGLAETVSDPGPSLSTRVQRGTTLVGQVVHAVTSSAIARFERRWMLTTAGLLPRPGYHQYDVFIRLSTDLMRNYQPSATFDGPILLLRGRHDEGVERDLGWSRLVTGPLTVVDVPADHYELMRNPPVEDVGRILRSAL
ncbi:MAG TPA: thioesterase domain-containing protein, partial [Acidimicrobiia bacterium]|nr:thioesterase domain-containing protein [Acidimicrobiia bacterium]